MNFYVEIRNNLRRNGTLSVCQLAANIRHYGTSPEKPENAEFYDALESLVKEGVVDWYPDRLYDDESIDLSRHDLGVPLNKRIYTFKGIFANKELKQFRKRIRETSALPV